MPNGVGGSHTCMRFAKPYSRVRLDDLKAKLCQIGRILFDFSTGNLKDYINQILNFNIMTT